MVPEIVRLPFEVVVIIPEMERVSPASGSVSFEMRLMVLFVESSVTMAESLLAVGALLEHEMVIVPVAILLVAPLASCTW